MRFALAALLLVACSRAVPLPVGEDASPVAAPDATPPVKVSRASTATMTEGVLSACTDVTIRGETDGGAIADFMAAETKRGAVEIAKGCSVQFADRTPLATCTLELDVPEKARHATWTQHHYLFEDVGTNDTAMSTCLAAKGSWEAVPRDSKAWREAKQEQARRALEKLSKKYTP